MRRSQGSSSFYLFIYFFSTGFRDQLSCLAANPTTVPGNEDRGRSSSWLILHEHRVFLGKLCCTSAPSFRLHAQVNVGSLLGCFSQVVGSDLNVLMCTEKCGEMWEMKTCRRRKV